MKKNNLILLPLLFFVQLFFAQGIERQILNGKIISDSTEVENITIYNLTSNIGAVSDKDGKFSLKARVTDTLYFQGVSFVSQKYSLTEKDFWVEELEIELKVKINELNEVVITPSTLTGVLEEDTKKIKTYNLSSVNIDAIKYHGDERFNSGTKVSTSPDHFAPNGSNFNFIAMAKGIGKLLGIKSNKEKNATAVFEERRLREIQSKPFAEHVKERYSHHFFISTLKIKNEDISSFLAFAEMPSKELVIFLKVENELQFLEYLIGKADEFEKQNNKN